MQLDHVAFRVNRENHQKAIDLFVKLFNYQVADEFEPEFDDNDTQQTICTVLAPKNVTENTPRVIEKDGVQYQLTPDIFISSSSDPDSIVAKYVKNRNNIGGIHHLAFTTDSVEKTMQEFKKENVEFLTETPLVCPELTQTFTKPSDLLNVIFEFLERRQSSFCKKNVGKLMQSTKNQI